MIRLEVKTGILEAILKQSRVKLNGARFILPIWIAMIACPVFSQARQSGSTSSEVNRSVVSSSYAQSASVSSQTVLVHFRNISSEIDRGYMDNARVFALLDKTLSDHSVSDAIDYITVVGSASPDGYTDRNERLAEERAQTIKYYILRNYPHIPKDRIVTYSAGEDWDGLRQMIEEDEAMPGRREAIQILNSSLSGDEKRKRLQKAASGATYKYLLDNMFPYLRGGATCMIYYKHDIRNQEDAPVESATHYTMPDLRRATSHNEITGNGNYTNYNLSAEQIHITHNNIYNNYGNERNSERRQDYAMRVERPSNIHIGQQEKNDYSQPQNARLYDYSQLHNMPSGQRPEKMLFAVKTNLLFDAITALNIEAEAPIGMRWSVLADYNFPWWLSEDKQFCFEMISGTLEVRRWLGYRENRPQLTGWFGGFFIGGGYFDFQKGSKGFQGEFNIMTGFSGGYAQSISKDGKWRMEYSLGLGIVSTSYREYKSKFGMDEEWHLLRQRNGKHTYVGPVKAKIAIVRTINRK